MPLSEHEQRLLEQIERALVDDDPKFASSVRTGDRRLKARRKLQIGAVLVVVGFAVLVGGVPSPARSSWGSSASSSPSAASPRRPQLQGRHRRGRGRQRPPAAGARGPGSPGRGGRIGRQPLKNRLEERFRRRYDQ